MVLCGRVGFAGVGVGEPIQHAASGVVAVVDDIANLAVDVSGVIVGCPPNPGDPPGPLSRSAP
jgi:hypothetical protein